MCNFSIYFSNIHMKQLQHTSETLETYVYNIRFHRNIFLLRSRITATTTFFTASFDRRGRLHRAARPLLTFSSTRNARRGTAQLLGAVTLHRGGPHPPTLSLGTAQSLARWHPPSRAPLHGIELRVDESPFVQAACRCCAQKCMLQAYVSSVSDVCCKCFICMFQK